MIVVYLDTHVVAWLYAGKTALLSGTARRRVENEDEPRISPVVQLELQHLFEIGRTAEPAATVIATLERAIGLRLCPRPFSEVVERALGEDWTRDPFDRLIVSQAALHEAPLLTRDRTIMEHYADAVW